MRGVGYRFRPKIEFLIKLLQFKTAGGDDISGCTEVPGDVADLFMYGPGKEPWKLFSGDQEIWELHDVNKRTIKEKYVITKLTKIGKKNVARTAGAGTWDDQSTAKPVVIGGHEMGHWRTLTYEYWGGDGAEEDKCYYYMNELHLSEHAITEARSWKTDEASDEVPYYVICRVLKNEGKRCRNRPSSKKRAVCTDNTGQDCPLPKKHRGINENKPSSSSSTAMGRLYVDRPGNYNNAGHNNHASYFSGPAGQIVPVQDPNMFGVAQNQLNQEQRLPGYYSALLHSRDYPELGNQGNWNSGCPSILPEQSDLIDNVEINWQQYMSSGFGDRGAGLVDLVRD